MGSLREMPNIIDSYDYKRPLDMSSLAMGLFNRAALSDTKEDKPEEKEKKGRKDE